MTLRLRDIAACFEGAVPSIVATAAGDGTPNISYLSHVALVDDGHVALSNQFFAKTASNVRENPRAALLVVDPRTNLQYRLDATWVRSEGGGALFEEVAAEIRATSAQVGLAGVMRLRALDVYRVDAVEAVRPGRPPPPSPAAPAPRDLTRLVRRVAEQTEAEGAIEALLDGAREALGADHAMVLVNDDPRGLLTTVASLGAGASGAGAEVRHGDGLIGLAAAGRRALRVPDVSRVRRFAGAAAGKEDRGRVIPLPGLPDAMSQVAVPMIAAGRVEGVLFAESRRALAFGEAEEAALAMLGHAGAAALALCEALAAEARGGRGPAARAAGPGRRIRVTHHAFDDSVFLDDDYVIKGVAGRLLAYLLATYVAEGRTEFTNREMRLAEALRLPGLKDNLETRLLLLRRRLDERGMPVRLHPAGRGRLRLEVEGVPVLRRVAADGSADPGAA